jgi:pimeloyl-ACP methyl ester carboxylesterase
VNASDRAGAQRARLHELMAVSEAERTVAEIRMSELKAEQDRARHRHIAAKGLVTRARKDGSAEKIAAAIDQLGLGQFGVCGISGGGPHALAVAACHSDRVRRCVTVVSLAPYGMAGLDFFAGMSAEDRQEWAWVEQANRH